MDTSRSQHRRSTQVDLAISSGATHKRQIQKRALEARTGIDCSHSFVLDLAYEEYCELREKKGAVDKSLFVGRFPDIRHSLIRRIEVHEFLEDVDLDGEQELKEIGPADFLFSNFRVIEKLGQGALGHVFLCEQSGVGDRQTVVKVAFQGAYEARTQGKLSHANIMPVYSVHMDETTMRSGICMPFYGRSTLCDVLDLAWKDASSPRSGDLLKLAATRWSQQHDRIEGSVKPADQDRDYLDSVLRIGVELASALEHSHERGVRHDDLKPSNILVGVNGQTLLLDFNLSSRDGEQSQCGGTLPYMSPEQIRRINSPRLEIDNRSDIFSLGILLYELLAGCRPFSDPEKVLSEDLAERHLEHLKTREIVPVSEYNAEVDQELNDIVLRCLRFHADDRYPDVATFGEALEQFQRRRNSRKLESPPRRSGIFKWIATSSLVAACVFFATATLSPLVGGGGQDEQAIAATYQVVGLDVAEVPASWEEAGPEFSEAWRLMKEQKYNEAMTALKLVLNSDSDSVHRGRAHACIAYVGSHLRSGRSETVRRHSQRAIELGFGNAAVWNNFGLVCAGRDGQQAFSKAIELKPDAWVACFNRAEGDLVQVRRSCVAKNYGAIPWVTMWQPYRAVSDIVRLRAEFPENGQVARVAADLLSYYARWDTSYRKELFDSLRVARQTGSHPLLDRDLPNYQWAASAPEYLEALKFGKNVNSFHTFDTLMDPLSN